MNLYGFVANGPLSAWDYLGLDRLIVGLQWIFGATPLPPFDIHTIESMKDFLRLPHAYIVVPEATIEDFFNPEHIQSLLDSGLATLGTSVGEVLEMCCRYTGRYFKYEFGPIDTTWRTLYDPLNVANFTLLLYGGTTANKWTKRLGIGNLGILGASSYGFINIRDISDTLPYHVPDPSDPLSDRGNESTARRIKSTCLEDYHFQQKMVELAAGAATGTLLDEGLGFFRGKMLYNFGFFNSNHWVRDNWHHGIDNPREKTPYLPLRPPMLPD